MRVNYLDIKKTIEAIVYVAEKTNDLFHIMKVLYYADKIHLEGYGRLITGDRYIAMKDGPVPSGAYDIIKSVRGDGLTQIDARPEDAFKVEDWTEIIPIRKPTLDYFSESDIEALNKSIETYAHMKLGELWDVAHEEPSYQQASFNSDISLTSIIESLDNAEILIEYLDS